MMAEKKEEHGTGRSKTKSWLNRRTFVGSLVALFGALNVWVFGKRNWWSKEQPIRGEVPEICELTVEGPFAEDRRIFLESPDCSFVEPQTLKISKRDDGIVKAKLEFMFKGPEKSDRQIDVRVDFHDASGNVLASKEVVCEDARIKARNPVAVGTGMLQLSRVNHEILKLQLDPDLVDSIALAKIWFLQV